MWTVGETAIILELAHTGLLEVTAHLRLIVRVHSTNIVSSRIVHGHGLKLNSVVKFMQSVLTSAIPRFSLSPCANEQASPKLHKPVSSKWRQSVVLYLM